MHCHQMAKFITEALSVYRLPIVATYMKHLVLQATMIGNADGMGTSKKWPARRLKADPSNNMTGHMA